MKYSDSIDRSSELLRLALPLMSKQLAARHPISYAVWYEFVSGRTMELNAELETLTAQDRKLDEEQTLALYRKHVLGIDESTAARVKAELERLLAQIVASAAQSGEQAAAYGRTLEQWSEELAGGDQNPAQLLTRIASVLEDTRQTRASVGNLEAVLAESRAEVEELREELQRVRTEAATDALTGLTNRKGLDRALAELSAATQGKSTTLSLMMVDIDYFKKVNDTYGHLFGDKVIRGVAQVLKANVKGRDVVARYGGEEFAVLLPETPAKGANSLAEQIRHQIAASRVRRLDRDEYVSDITVSVGITVYRPGELLTDFVGRADAALYASKTNGRNRVTVQ
jgi:diguanylate cyclase